MDAMKAAPPKSTARRLAVGACLLIALFSRLSFLGDPFKNDAGIYVCMGKSLWQGGRLYQDFWETKLPSVPLLVAPFYGLFGNHWLPYVLLEAAMGILAAWALAAALKRTVGDWTYPAALLMGLIALNVSRLTLTGFQLETFQIFFEVLAACMVLGSLKHPGNFYALAAGFLAALAAMAKPTGFAVAAAAAAVYFLEARHRGRAFTLSRLCALSLGCAIPVVLVVGWILISPWRNQMPYLLAEIRLYASGTPWRSLLQFKTWIFFALPLTPWLIRSIITQHERLPDESVIVFAWAWLVLEIAAVIVQRRLYGYHFLVLMPPAVMIFALWTRNISLPPILLAIAPLALISLYFSARNYLSSHNPGPMPASVYVASHSAPGDSVWGDPAARLILETGLNAGSRLQMTFYFVNHDNAPQEFSDTLLNDFESRKPKYIVLPVNWRQEQDLVAANTPGLIWRPQRKQSYRQACDRIRQYIKTHYHIETTLDGKAIYRRNSAPL